VALRAGAAESSLDASAGEPPAGLRRGALRAANLPECGRSKSFAGGPPADACGVALRAGAARHSEDPTASSTASSAYMLAPYSKQLAEEQRAPD